MDPIISVIIAVRNEEKNIGACLDSLLAQSFSQFEAIVIDGHSVDRTAQIVHEFVTRDPRVKYQLNLAAIQSISANRNLGLKIARGEFIATTDADCVVPTDWLIKLYQAWGAEHDSMLGAIGGANIAPPNGSVVTRVISAVQSSRLGFIGSAQGQVFQKNIEVRSVSCTNAMFRRTALLDINGFNERLGNIGEDYELCFRLRQRKLKIKYVAGSFVWHQMRTTWRGFWRNMYVYGQGRMRLIKLLPERPLKYFLPGLFILLMIATIISGFEYWWLWLIPAAYVLAISIQSYFLTLKQQVPWRLSMLAYLILYFAYGVGELLAIFKK